MSTEVQFKKGQHLIAVNTHGVELYLTYGKTYVALTDTQEGIFSDRPYITVEPLGGGKKYSAHASRFKSKELQSF